MISPPISVLLPHLRNTSNDAAVRIAIDTLAAHTDLDYELMVEAVAERRDIYAVINRMARRALGEYIIPWNSDVFASPNWLAPLWTLRDPQAIVSPTMVECGAIPVNDRNLRMDFGRTPQTFRRAEFEAWVQAGGGWRDDWRDGDAAWYFPSLINRRAFLDIGGFDTSKGGFPDPLDMDLWERWEKHGGTFQRVQSWVYHLQVWSDQARGVRE